MQSKRIEMYRADTETLVVIVKRGTAPLNLTGATIVFSVKQTEDDTSYLIQKTSADALELEITDAVNGECKIYLVENDTTDLTPGFYPYDIEITLPSGAIKTVAKEFLVIEQDITE